RGSSRPRWSSSRRASPSSSAAWLTSYRRADVGEAYNLTARARISDGGARREGHRRAVLTLLVDPGDLDLLAGDLRMDRVAQLVQGVDGLAVDRADDGGGRHPHLRGRAARLDAGHEDTCRVAQPELGRRGRVNRLHGHAHEASLAQQDL